MDTKIIERKAVKISPDAWRKLRMLAAQTDETLGKLNTRLIDAEWQRVVIADALGEAGEAQP